MLEVAPSRLHSAQLEITCNGMGAATLVKNTNLLKKTASAVRSISAIEFSNVWKQIWLKSRGTGLGANPESTIGTYIYFSVVLVKVHMLIYISLGLAISGGVDSMALAFLCSSMRETLSATNRVNFRAFVVDHGVRDGSDVEALAVSTSLENRGN